MNSDRFRFRYWDNIIGKMKYPSKIFYPENGNVFFSFDTNSNENDDEVCAYTLWPDKEYPNVIMACTGLRDKHGTLIYEGDVLNIGEDYATKPPSPLYKAFKFNNDIRSCSCCFYELMAVGLSIDDVSNSDSYDWEIVGHIFMPEWEHLK